MPINEIKKQRNQVINRNFILGIDGLGGAGKTTFTESLVIKLAKDNIQSVVFHMDDFIYPRTVRYTDRKQAWHDYYYSQWRYDYFINKVLLPVQKGRNLNKKIELYNKFDDLYQEMEVIIPRNAIIIVDGVFLQRSILRGYFDYIIFIQLSKDERLKRIIKRDTYIGEEQEIVNKYLRRYFPAEKIYIKKYAPRDKADYIIYG